MRHLLVTDSNIFHSLGYDHDTERLEVVFSTDTRWVYQYEGVGSDMFINLICAKSIGEHFHKIIKSNAVAFRCTKLPMTNELRKAVRL